jgi:hypothetical protein
MAQCQHCGALFCLTNEATSPALSAVLARLFELMPSIDDFVSNGTLTAIEIRHNS